MTLRIYKIVDDTTGNCYIGSTKKTLRRRLKNHEYDMIQWMEGKKPWITSFDILNNNDYHIELLEEIEQYQDRNQIEGRYIREAQNCVNKRVEGRSPKEYYQQYYEQNKEKIKEKKNQKVECECGGCYTIINRSHHYKTMKHLHYTNNHN